MHNDTLCSPSQSPIVMGPEPSGRGFRIQARQWLPAPRDRVFEFFSDAFQLETLTPPWLRFSVLTPPPIQIARGSLIDYRLRIRGVPIRWQSEISVWDPPFRFVDEQLRGPYRRWRHEHRFEEFQGGTFCQDVIDYEVYGGPLINALFVRSDVRQIFKYRQEQLQLLFPFDETALINTAFHLNSPL